MEKNCESCLECHVTTDEKYAHFNYHSIFDNDTGECEDASGKFEIEIYRKGIEQYKKNGYCKIEGEECSLELSNLGEIVQIDIEGSGNCNKMELQCPNFTIDKFVV